MDRGGSFVVAMLALHSVGSSSNPAENRALSAEKYCLNFQRLRLLPNFCIFYSLRGAMFYMFGLLDGKNTCLYHNGLSFH